MNKLSALALATVLTLAGAGSAFAESMTASDAFDDLGRANFASIVTVQSSSDNQIVFSGGRIDYPVDIASLQSRVSQNWVIADQLADAGYVPSDVIGIETAGSGDVTLYVRG